MSGNNHDDQNPNPPSGGAEAEQHEGTTSSIGAGIESLLIGFGATSSQGRTGSISVGIESLFIPCGVLAGFAIGIWSYIDMSLVFGCTAIGWYVGMSAWLIARRLLRGSFPSASAVWAVGLVPVFGLLYGLLEIAVGHLFDALPIALTVFTFGLGLWLLLNRRGG